MDCVRDDYFYSGADSDAGAGTGCLAEHSDEGGKERTAKKSPSLLVTVQIRLEGKPTQQLDGTAANCDISDLGGVSRANVIVRQSEAGMIEDVR